MMKNAFKRLISCALSGALALGTFAVPGVGAVENELQTASFTFSVVDGDTGGYVPDVDVKFLRVVNCSEDPMQNIRNGDFTILEEWNTGEGAPHDTAGFSSGTATGELSCWIYIESLPEGWCSLDTGESYVISGPYSCYEAGHYDYTITVDNVKAVETTAPEVRFSGKSLTEIVDSFGDDAFYQTYPIWHGTACYLIDGDDFKGYFIREGAGSTYVTVTYGTSLPVDEINSELGNGEQTDTVLYEQDGVYWYGSNGEVDHEKAVSVLSGYDNVLSMDTKYSVSVRDASTLGYLDVDYLYVDTEIDTESFIVDYPELQLAVSEYSPSEPAVTHLYTFSIGAKVGLVNTEEVYNALKRLMDSGIEFSLSWIETDNAIPIWEVTKNVYTNAAAAGTVWFNSSDFYVVVGTFSGYTQLRRFYRQNGIYTVDKIVWQNATEGLEYGDVFCPDGDVTLTEVYEAPDDPIYRFAKHYEVGEDAKLVKVGTCAELMSTKELTEGETFYDGSAHYTVEFTDENGTEYKYGLNNFGSALGIKTIFNAGAVYSFAFLGNTIIIPLAVLSEPEPVTETTTLAVETTTTTELLCEIDTTTTTTSTSASTQTTTSISTSTQTSTTATSTTTAGYTRTTPYASVSMEEKPNPTIAAGETKDLGFHTSLAKDVVFSCDSPYITVYGQTDPSSSWQGKVTIKCAADAPEGDVVLKVKFGHSIIPTEVTEWEFKLTITPQTEPRYEVGDANRDGLLDGADASLILSTNADYSDKILENGEIDYDYLIRAYFDLFDVNKDGLIDGVDASLVLVRNAELSGETE